MYNCVSRFSDEGAVFYMDVEGVVRTRDKHCWVPVAFTRQLAKSKSDHYWLVSISLKQQQIRCIPCKGSRFPATLPRPALAVLPFQMSLCDMESEKTKYEEAYQRNSIVARSLSCLHGEEDDEINKLVREALVKLFAFAAKSERDFRALEVCEMMGDHSLLQIAATYSMRLRRMQLAERVSEYMHVRQEEQVTQEEEEHGNQSDDELATDSHSLRNEDSDEEETEVMDVESKPKQISGPSLVTKVDKSAKTSARLAESYNPFKVTGSAERRAGKGTQIFDKMEKTTPKSTNIFAPLPINIKKSGKKANVNQTKLLGFNKTSKAATPTAHVKQEVSSEGNQEEEKSENQPLKK
ncbi:WD repeat and hmg-box DNA-binding protein 1 [Plakobranchus ocellatus]|uniref:WD repeat and hmg-box DNA-binding protein 1 n=1 Tax=Plakobranchus ocellatus TaxID=259542 RepID=A0AAV3ZSJ7_9GAST|nr:WD repeat and hmg-box DNA-binding protein 1 [Plakobranchus ocellatus]